MDARQADRGRAPGVAARRRVIWVYRAGAVALLAAILAGCASTGVGTPFVTAPARDVPLERVARIAGNSSDPSRAMAVLLKEVDGEPVPVSSDGVIASPVHVLPGIRNFKVQFGTSASEAQDQGGRVAMGSVSATLLPGRSYVIVGTVDESIGNFGGVRFAVKDIGDQTIPPICFALNLGDPTGECKDYDWYPKRRSKR